MNILITEFLRILRFILSRIGMKIETEKEMEKFVYSQPT